MVEKARCPVQKDAVYRWFSELSSWQRAEFLCGLLDLCLPLELRFLGSCLEDLARKDYHSLRDSEIKANNPADLGTLTNLTDEVVRSKLLVSLALLTSENREAAGVLCRTLTHMDSIINNLGLQLNDGRTGDEFLLLFTMATNHPAFSFHQKQLLRKELAHLQGRHGAGGHSGPTTTTTTPLTSSKISSGCPKLAPRTETSASGAAHGLAHALHTSAHSIEDSLPKRPSGKHSKVTIEKIDIKVSPHKKKERNSDCSFEVCWSDSSVTSVIKSSGEISELVSKLVALYSEDLEKCIPYPGALDSSYSMDRNHVDLEPDLRYLMSLPSHLLKSELVRKFFTTSTGQQPLPGLGLGSTSHVKVNSPVGPTIRPICGVAGIPSSHSSLSLHHSGATISLSPCSGSSLVTYRQQVEPSPAPSSVPSPQTQEQQDILEWLRKLRLHKYYAVFSQLSMKKFLSLTEEDLNKFESLTMGAKKKLKTQLELEKEKSEKRCLNPAPCTFPGGGGGVARVPPTSHVGPMQSVHCSHSIELSVEVEPSQLPQEGSSSPESSSSPSSPLGLRARGEESSDSAEETDRRLARPPDGGEKEKSSLLLVNHFPSARPTAQVLPVQNEAGTHHPMPLQMMAGAQSHMPPLHLISTMLKPGTSPHPLLLPPEDRAKAAPRGAIKPEKSFGNLLLDVKGGPGQILSVMPESSRASRPGKESVPPAAPSFRAPVKLLVSTGGESPAVRNNVPYAANTKVAFSTVPVAPLAAGFCPSSTSPTSENSYYGNVNLQVAGHHAHAQQQSGCSSCGCSGSCGGGNVTVNYGNYFQQPFSPASVFPFSLVPFGAVCNNGYAPQQYGGGGGGGSAFPYPADSMQPGFSLPPPLQSFMAGAAGVYQPQGMMGVGNNGAAQPPHKRPANVSCYNCGGGGHRAQDCKQPPMDFNQQGTYRLKFSPPSDSLDSAE